MAPSKTYLWISTAIIFIQSCVTSAQEATIFPDPFAEYENPFRHAEEGESLETRALELLGMQKYNIVELGDQLKHYQVKLSQEKQRNEVLQSALVQSILRHLRGTTEDRLLAIELLNSYLSSQLEQANQITVLDRSLELAMEQALHSDDLRDPVIHLFRSHLTTKGIQLGYQPGLGNWRAIGEVTEMGKSELRRRLAATTECHYLDYMLGEVIDELSVVSDVDIPDQLTDDQMMFNVKYVSDNVSFGQALTDILTVHDLDYCIKAGRVLIGSKDDPRIVANEIFVVSGLLSSELQINKLIELTQKQFVDTSPEFQIVNQTSFIVHGTESQLRKVSEFLGRFLPAPLDLNMPSVQSIHPAREFANRVIQAAQAHDFEKLFQLASISPNARDRWMEFFEEVEVWFEGVDETTEIRRDGDSYLAKLQVVENEVMVIRFQADQESFIWLDVNSPSIEDYRKLESLPLHEPSH